MEETTGDYDIMGIDPGLRGAAALLRRGWNRHGRFSYTFLDMADLETVEIENRSHRQLDTRHLRRLIERWDPDIVVLEDVQPPVRGNKFGGPDEQRMSNMSASDAFRFGRTCGIIYGIVCAYEIEPVMVNPRSWKHHFGLKGSDKKPHVACIKQLAPSSAPFITLAKHDGRADAALMALWHAQKTGFV